MRWCNRCCRWIPVDPQADDVHTCFDARREYALTEDSVVRRKADGHVYRDFLNVKIQGARGERSCASK